ncbi:MAG: transposase [Mesoflavibacter sp.]|nr:transposase [Mesoflavibacter sp.]
MKNYKSINPTCWNTTINNLFRKLHISIKIKDEFKILLKRWIAPRTFGWFNHFRRLTKDFEILTKTAENMIRIAMISINIRKLTNF